MDPQPTTFIPKPLRQTSDLYSGIPFQNENDTDQHTHKLDDTFHLIPNHNNKHTCPSNEQHPQHTILKNIKFYHSNDKDKPSFCSDCTSYGGSRIDINNIEAEMPNFVAVNDHVSFDKCPSAASAATAAGFFGLAKKLVKNSSKQKKLVHQKSFHDFAKFEHEGLECCSPATKSVPVSIGDLYRGISKREDSGTTSPVAKRIKLSTYHVDETIPCEDCELHNINVEKLSNENNHKNQIKFKNSKINRIAVNDHKTCKRKILYNQMSVELVPEPRIENFETNHVCNEVNATIRTSEPIMNLDDIEGVGSADSASVQDQPRLDDDSQMKNDQPAKINNETETNTEGQMKNEEQEKEKETEKQDEKQQKGIQKQSDHESSDNDHSDTEKPLFEQPELMMDW